MSQSRSSSPCIVARSTASSNNERDYGKKWPTEAESKGWSGPKYLSNLCEQEIADRDRRRLSRHMTEAQLPKGKTLESYDFGAIAGVSKSKIAWFSIRRSMDKEGMNVLIFGSSGVGKTHLAAAIGEKLVENGFRVSF